LHPFRSDHAELGAGPADGTRLISQIVGCERPTLAFDDVCRPTACLFLAVLVWVPFCKAPRIGTKPSPDAHRGVTAGRERQV